MSKNPNSSNKEFDFQTWSSARILEFRLNKTRISSTEKVSKMSHPQTTIVSPTTISDPAFASSSRLMRSPTQVTPSTSTAGRFAENVQVTTSPEIHSHMFAEVPLSQVAQSSARSDATSSAGVPSAQLYTASQARRLYGDEDVEPEFMQLPSHSSSTPIAQSGSGSASRPTNGDEGDNEQNGLER